MNIITIWIVFILYFSTRILFSYSTGNFIRSMLTTQFSLIMQLWNKFSRKKVVMQFDLSRNFYQFSRNYGATVMINNFLFDMNMQKQICIRNCIEKNEVEWYKIIKDMFTNITTIVLYIIFSSPNVLDLFHFQF